MMKVFMIGHGPIPAEKNVQCQTAFGLRTWQFLSLAATTQAEFFVVLIADKNHYVSAPIFYETETLTVFGTKILLLRVEKNNPKTKKLIQQAYKKFAADVCIGVNLPASYQLAQLKPTVPFWADLNGWAMTEGQSQAWTEKNNGYLPFLWQQEKKVLQVADKISTVAHTQKYATYGELATLGRLNYQTDEYDFVSTIANANEVSKSRSLVEIQTKPERVSPKQKISLRDKLNLPKDAFIVFFSGAYNTWLDSHTMFAGVEAAMQANQKIYFVSTGGAASVSNHSLTRFQNLIKHNAYQDRFYFLGWITTDELHAYYEQVDLAINIDRPNHETTFGARNRINEWVLFGVPTLSTIRSEITAALLQVHGIIGIECRDHNDLAQKILAASNNQIDLKQLVKNAQTYAQKNWSYKKTLEPISNWLATPVKSPDYRQKISLHHPSLWRKIWFHLQKDGLKSLVQKLIRK